MNKIKILPVNNLENFILSRHVLQGYLLLLIVYLAAWLIFHFKF
jgi:hypothetical protein